MIRSLVDEAISSSQIEGAVTTKVVAKEMLRTGRKPKDRSEQMIYNNFLSMQMIKKRMAEPLSIELMLEIHSMMTENTLEDPSWAGRFRTAEDDASMSLTTTGRQSYMCHPGCGCLCSDAGTMRLCEQRQGGRVRQSRYQGNTASFLACLCASLHGRERKDRKGDFLLVYAQT